MFLIGLYLLIFRNFYICLDDFAIGSMDLNWLFSLGQALNVTKVLFASSEGVFAFAATLRSFTRILGPFGQVSQTTLPQDVLGGLGLMISGDRRRLILFVWVVLSFVVANLLLF